MTPAESRIREWRHNPCKFVYEELGATPDKWQEQLLNAFGDPDPSKQRIAMKACAGPGKTAGMAMCALNFISCHGTIGEHPKGAAVAVTEGNLKDNFWPELSKWQQRSRTGYLKEAFRWNKERFFAVDHSEDWFISARSWPKTASAEDQGATLSGCHSQYVAFFIDESSGIPLTVLRAAEQALSNCTFGKILQAGNPSNREGMLYAAVTRLRQLWHVITITGDPLDPHRSPRIGLQWAQEQIDTWGRDNPWVMAYILGEFPPSSINSLFDIEEVEKSAKLNLLPPDYEGAQKRLGIDCARFGDDRTVIFPRQGLRAHMYVTMRNARSNEIAARAIVAKTRYGSEAEFVDGTGGYGSGVIDSMIQAGYAPHEIHFSSAATEAQRYLNKRAEMWFRMRDWMRRGGQIPNSQELIKELVSPTYTFVNGKFQLEPKEQIKKRLGFSPDIADALALTFAHPELPASMESRFPSIKMHGSNDGRFGRAASEWEPTFD